MLWCREPHTTPISQESLYSYFCKDGVTLQIMIAYLLNIFLCKPEIATVELVVWERTLKSVSQK